MAAALQHDKGNFADVFHVEAPLFKERQSSGKGLACSDAQASWEKWLDLVLLILGGVIALAAPLVSCAIGHESDITANTWDQCWTKSDPSLSEILITPVGSAYFATGLAMFYCIYLKIFLRITSGLGWSCNLVAVGVIIETIAALVCVSHPYVHPLKVYHGWPGFRSWVLVGTLTACVLALERNTMSSLFLVRALVLTTFTGALSFIYLTKDVYNHGQMFLITEYSFLAVHVLFSIVVVKKYN